MTNVKFSKKEIKEILNSEFTEKINRLVKEITKNHCYFNNGVECKSVSHLVSFLQETEGNYLTLDLEIKTQLKSLLND